MLPNYKELLQSLGYYFSNLKKRTLMERKGIHTGEGRVKERERESESIRGPKKTTPENKIIFYRVSNSKS